MRTGLYSPGDFKDNCGFGLIAHANGWASHRLLTTAIESLTCMTHRGGIAADGKTGDGCGLLLQKPTSFLRAVAQEQLGAELADEFAVGQIFLNPEASKAAAARDIMAASLEAEGLTVIGWRPVPIDSSICGEIALESLPLIEQVFVERGSAKHFNVALYIARRKAEKQLAEDESFYVCSLSDSVISYKGLVMPADLNVFYKDLADQRLETAICVFHQRFSTNTLPKWPLAQPFRYLAHNGEINTIMGNRNWAAAREKKFQTELLPNIEAIAPLVNRTGSDSSSLDNMLDVLLMGGMDIHKAIRMLVPPAWQNVDDMDPDHRAFYDYMSMHMEPWDGPAGMVMTNGRYAVCMLDRNGLRPARWVQTKDGFVTVASEVGTHDYKPEDVLAKGRVGPGQIMSIDTSNGQIRFTDEVDGELMRAQPYKKWLREQAIPIEATMDSDLQPDLLNSDDIAVFQKLFNVTNEERDMVIRPMAEAGQEAVGSMGDDTPMAVLSGQVRSLYDYFRQQFAQVTNPPIDPLREAIVMSLETCLGAEKNIFEETPESARRITLTSPVLSPNKFTRLMALDHPDFGSAIIDLNYDPTDLNLQQAIVNVADQAEALANEGKVLLVLSDRNVEQGKLPIHALLATGAVHHRLIKTGLRCETNLIVETATARDSHQIATLVGFGASAVYPYLSFNVITDLIRTGELLTDEASAYNKYRKGLNKGLLKILSKMGISTIASYRGAQLFEAMGIAKEVADLCFTGVSARIEGADFIELENDQAMLAKVAWIERRGIGQGGLLKYVHGTEYHAYNPDVVQTLQAAVQNGDYETYKKYAGLVNNRPVATVRDLFNLSEDVTPISIDEVEPLADIFCRFDSAGMSLGALSPEAHEALATAMNRLGARTNSGEGGGRPCSFWY